MKIIKCPSCNELVHFDQNPGVERCWNCGSVTDFSRIQSAELKLLLRADHMLSRLLCLDVEMSSFTRIGRVGLTVALPVAITMLLICNSLDISILQEAHLPFASERIPGTESEEVSMGS